MMKLYGIRGATTVSADTPAQILSETQKLLSTIFAANGLSITEEQQENFVSIIFTTTPDLQAEFPAKAARSMGLNNVSLLGCVEADVPHGLPLCIRVLIHVYLEKGTKIKHVYLNNAVQLRPDLQNKSMQITIDGPAGAGKSTIARMLANRLGYLYIDTGAMYRAITSLALKKGLSLDDEEALRNLTTLTKIELLRQPNGEQEVYCNGINVTDTIRAPLISQNVSKVAMHPGVRQELVNMQRILAHQKNVVMDGRDAGTVILPEAACKIFLTASLEERAQRRYLELQKKGYKNDLAFVKADLAQRDYLDENRSSSPLKPAQDAVIVDTTALSPEEVVKEILRIVSQKKNQVEDENS
jgi:cytidylate kinase